MPLVAHRGRRPRGAARERLPAALPRPRPGARRGRRRRRARGCARPPHARLRQRGAARGRPRRARAPRRADRAATICEARAVRWSCPQWIGRRASTEDLGPRRRRPRSSSAANEAPERCLRVNPLRGDAASAVRRSAEAGLRRWRACPACPRRCCTTGPPLESSAPFAAGARDARSRAARSSPASSPPDAGRPPRAILDLCAAPGTKTAQLGGGAPARSRGRRRGRRAPGGGDARQPAPSRRRRRSRSSRPTPRASCRPRAEAFDAVLVDAPCSGLGTLGSRADLRWRRRHADVARLAAEQRRLLAAGARCVRPGGALTYAVCTVTRAETDGVVRSLLETGGWALDDLGAEYPGRRAPGERRLPARAAAGLGEHGLLRRPPAARARLTDAACWSRAAASVAARADDPIECLRDRHASRPAGGEACSSTLNEVHVAPSILSADFARLGDDVEIVLAAGARSSTSTSWTGTSCPTSPSARWSSAPSRRSCTAPGRSSTCTS